MNKKQHWVFLVVLFLLAVGGGLYSLGAPRSSSLESGQQAMTCDLGISSARQNRDGQRNRVADETMTVKDHQARLNEHRPSGPTPYGMVWIPGGEFWMGADEFPDAQPWHRVWV